MKLFKKAKRGFTLVELVVVIAVIAILAAVSVGAYFGITESANNSRLEQEAKAAHTNIQLVAMNQDNNSNLTREGLYINDLDTFETKMESYSGFHYDIVAQEPSAVNNPTLYFCNETVVSSANIVNQRFNTFKYYNPEVGNKRASVNIPSGDITIEEATFELGDPEPIVIKSIGFDGIDDTVDSFFVGARKTFNVITEPAGLGYTFEIEHENVLKIEGNEIVAIGAGESKVTVRSQNLDSYGVQLTDEITVNVTAVEPQTLNVTNVINKTYFVNDSINLSDFKYDVTFNNGKSREIEDYSKISVTPSTFNTPGNITVVFTYNDEGKMVSHSETIFVSAISLDSLQCDVNKIEGNFYDGDILENIDVKFTATYNNGEVIQNITLNDVSYNKTLYSSQTSIEFTYPKEGTNQKTISVEISTVKPLELESLSVTTVSGNKPVYNVGEVPTKENLNFIAHYKDRGSKPISDLSKIEIVTPSITNGLESVVYSYTEGEITKTCSLEIEVHFFETFYFLNQGWWKDPGSVPYINLFDGSGNPIFEGKYGIQMDLVDNSLFMLTNNQMYQANLDVFNATAMQIYRIRESNGEYIEACTVMIDINEIIENNTRLIVLTNTATWCSEESFDNPADVSFEVVTKNKVPERQLHIVGLDANEEGITLEEAWKANNDNKFSFNSDENIYTLEGVRFEYNDEFKFYLSNFGSAWIGYSNISEKLMANGLYFTQTSDDNIKIGVAEAGVYNISITGTGNISFEKTDETLNFAICGQIKGDSDAWGNESKWINASRREGNKIYFDDILLDANDKILIRSKEVELSEEGIKYGYSSITEDTVTNLVRDDNNDIFIKYTGTYDFVLDISKENNESLTITANVKLYLKPNDNWVVDNARFAAYFFGNGDTWASMTDSDSDGIYEVNMPTDKIYTSVIFCRMNPSTTDNNFNKGVTRNQTGDLTIPIDGKNLFTIPDGARNDSTESRSSK